MPRSIMKRVEAVMNREELLLSKNVWFLQAVMEKLERDEPKFEKAKVSAGQ
jgi:hypothetical protein